MLASNEVLVAVPISLAEAVMGYRDDLLAGHVVPVPQGDQEKPETVSVAGQGDWTKARVVRLHEVLPYELVVALLDRCAAEPGEWVAKQSLPQGKTPYHLRNQLSALSKLVISEFGEKSWPMEWRKHNGGYEYRMPPKVAGWWSGDE
jgi:hypothetical protein